MSERVPGAYDPLEPYDRALALRSVGPGWHPLINRLFDELPAGVVVVQVKQKLGGLRVYLDDAAETSDDTLAFRKLKSEITLLASRTCEICGSTGRHRDRASGWMTTLCDEHDEEKDDRVLVAQIRSLPRPDVDR